MNWLEFAISEKSMAFGAHTTLGYSEDSGDVGGTLSVTEGTSARSLRSSATTWPQALLRRQTATVAHSSRRRRKR